MNNDANAPTFKVKVRLETREGSLVGEPEIPAFKMLPEVLMWGSRVFKQVDPRVVDGALVHPYAEAFCFVITDLVIP